ncbi:MAG: TrmH family RNA methyltransferase [Bacteroidales bacterium]
MTTPAPITSRRNPVVARFREAASSGTVSALMLLEGEHLVEEALRAGIPIAAVAATPAALAIPGSSDLLERAQRGGAEAFRVAESVMAALSPVRTPSGIVALASRPRATTDDALQRQPSLVVCAVDVQDPGNVGAIVRASEAGGATGVLLAGACADPFSWKALRGSMGSALRLVVAAAPLDEAVDAARARGLKVLATVPRGGRTPYEVDLRAPCLLLVGGEGPGLAEGVVRGADDRITIPMRPPVESLNVAVAAALLVYEASRQRAR